MLDLERKKHTN